MTGFVILSDGKPTPTLKHTVIYQLDTQVLNKCPVRTRNIKLVVRPNLQQQWMFWWFTLIQDLWAGPGWRTCAFWVSSSLYLSCCSNLSFCSISFCIKKSIYYTRRTLIKSRRLPEAIKTVTPHLTVTPQPIIFLHLPLQLCLRSVRIKKDTYYWTFVTSSDHKNMLFLSRVLSCRTFLLTRSSLVMLARRSSCFICSIDASWVHSRCCWASWTLAERNKLCFNSNKEKVKTTIWECRLLTFTLMPCRFLISCLQRNSSL